MTFSLEHFQVEHDAIIMLLSIFQGFSKILVLDGTFGLSIEEQGDFFPTLLWSLSSIKVIEVIYDPLDGKDSSVFM
jgi:hypothetical protein